jgi:hypothetical protein
MQGLMGSLPLSIRCTVTIVTHLVCHGAHNKEIGPQQEPPEGNDETSDHLCVENDYCSLMCIRAFSTTITLTHISLEVLVEHVKFSFHKSS